MMNIPSLDSETAMLGHIGAMPDSFRVKATEPNRIGVDM